MWDRFADSDAARGVLPRRPEVVIERRTLCVVAPMHNESANLDALVERLTKVAGTLRGWDLQLLLVDDGSRDDSILKLKGLRAAGRPVGFLQLSRNFGHQAALQAGLMHAPGDAVVTMDADLQHPPEMIAAMIEKYEEGYDVVQMVREEQVGGSKGLFSTLFYQAFNSMADTKIIPDASDFRLLSRRFLDVLNRIPEREKFLRGLIPSLGFKQTTMPYQQAERLHGRPSYTFRKSLKLARKALFDFSNVPLQFVFASGILLSVFSFFFGLTSIVLKLVWWHQIEPGYTDLIVAICFLSGVILASVGILGRYMMSILDQLRGRPSFVVMDHANPEPLATNTDLFGTSPQPAKRGIAS